MSATHFEEQPGKIDLFSLSEAPSSLYEQDASTLFQELRSYGRPDLIARGCGVVPRKMVDWFGEPNAKSERVMKALMQMGKLDVATLEKAYNG